MFERVTVNDKELVVNAIPEVLVVVIATVVEPSASKDTSVSRCMVELYTICTRCKFTVNEMYVSFN